MKARVFALGLAAALCVLPLCAQGIPAGDDTWDSVGGGATSVTLTSADWRSLCGVTVADTSVQLKGYNIPGQGTADTVVTRLENAALSAIGSSATIKIQLKDLSLVSDGPNPCSPKTLRVTEDTAQAIGTMTITKTSSAGGTFTAKVPVNAIIEALDSSGNPTGGSTYVSGVLGDDSASPWSYAPPTTGVMTAATAAPWHPGVDPATKQPVRVCRRGNKTLPAWHCYWPPPKCKAVVKPVPTDLDAAVAPAPTEPCFIETQPTDTSRK